MTMREVTPKLPLAAPSASSGVAISAGKSLTWQFLLIDSCVFASIRLSQPKYRLDIAKGCQEV
jgi:hypothetical protein